MYFDFDDNFDPDETGCDGSENSNETGSGDYDNAVADETPENVQSTPEVVDDIQSDPAPDPWSADPQEQKTYYEPWHEAVYHEPEERQKAYTPGPHYDPIHSAPQHQQTNAEKPRGRHGFLKAVCLVLVCALVASAASYGVIDYRISKGDLSTGGKTVVIGSSGNSGSASTTPLASSGSEMSGSDLYDMACEQVVGIKTSVTTTNIFGQTTSGAVSGSGFIISSDGYIVTNYHVIEYAVLYGYELTVMLHDGTSYTAKIIGYEEDNDVAVIKIDAAGLNAVTMGTSSGMVVGEKVYAVGNPLGELEYTMTSGIVSALDRVITTADSTNNTTTSINMFQIDAAVNSGNSGGPVYNAKGEVIGIVSAKYSKTGVEGLGFAIPIDDALTIVSDLIENGYVTGKAYFGITIQSMTTSYAQYYGLVEGACVMTVDSGSCAEKAGLAVGDVITKLGDTAITSRDDLLTAKKNFKAGDTTTITAYRNGEYLDFVITFDEEPASTAVTSGSVQDQQQSQQQQQGLQDYFSNWGSGTT